MNTEAPDRLDDRAAAPRRGVRARARLAREALDRWPEALARAGFRVLLPVASGGAVEYVVWGPGQTAAAVFGRGAPRLSPKAAWFPRTEPVLHLDRKAQEWDVADPGLDFPRTVVLGAPPCDAAAPEILKPLFGWDLHDPFFERRLERLAFVVQGCAKPMDPACFCTTTGVDPAGEGMGDVLLTPLSDGAVLAEAHTEQGEEILKAAGLSPGGDGDSRGLDAARAARDAARRAVPVRADLARVRAALERRFVDPRWEESSRSCLACGTCAFACPTCHCFDLQEELCGCQGVRQKNWDACAFPLFTMHTSGHNPRPDQASRWRQRLSHKFRYYPEKFGRALCTGCGRCLRLCPAGMDLLSDLQALDRDADGAAASPASAAPAPAPAEAPGGTNLYRSYKMRIVLRRDETADIRTLRLEFLDPGEAEAFRFGVGQFGLYGAFGEGEATFCIASAPTRRGYIECTFREAGRVTKALRRLDVGDVLGFRGPYGNTFPVDAWKGRHLLFVAGGVALPPMRCVIQYCLDNRADYGNITIVYGARTEADHVYKDELAEWERRPDVSLWRCIDWKPRPDGKGLSDEAAQEGWRPVNRQNPGATVLDPSHRRYTAFVPQMVEAVKPSPEHCVTVLCGPPVMINFTLKSLKGLGFDPRAVYTTLENRMKCGFGKCGRCNVGPVYVCKEGPVFTADRLESLPPEW